jgi:hypothetical protein
MARPSPTLAGAAAVLAAAGTLLIGACVGPGDGDDDDDADPADTALDTGPHDADGDGFYTPEDCDDTRAEVYPGAPEDPPGDGIDGDCDGHDGPQYVGCPTIHVPDLYATIADAVVDGKYQVCLGEGTFTTEPIPDGDYPSSILGQGRDRTFLVDPGAHYRAGVLKGMHVTGFTAGDGNFDWSDVTAEDADISGFNNFSCTRCLLDGSTIELAAEKEISGITLFDSWLTGSEAAVHVTTSGCKNNGSCDDIYMDVRMYNSTFSGNEVALDFDMSGDWRLYLEVQNSIFVDHGGSVMEVEVIDSGGSGSPSIGPSGGQNTAWNSGGGEHFPDGVEFRVNDKDPELDFAFRPPRPSDDSESIDATNELATATDFWNQPRDPADRGAVER